MSSVFRLASFLLVLLVSGCASLPSLENRVASTAIRDTADTRLGQAIAPLAARKGALPADAAAYVEPGKPVKAGLYALAGGREALAARVVLADAAERALDIQYYMWHSDRSGTFMFDAVRRAADRGVRVRLLLDDHGTPGQDKILWVLDRHRNIEVRLFNPFAHRRFRSLGYLTEFTRLNRRMHNKSFTADNQATIIGGRNIADEYFDLTEDVAFADLDVLAVGAIVDQVSTDFDRYWSSRSAYPVDRLLAPVEDEEAAALMAEVAAAGSGPAFSDYTEAVQKTVFLRQLFQGELELEWATTRMVSDDPAKVLNHAGPSPSLPGRMQDLFGKPRELVEMVTAYFVPMQEGVDYLVAMARRGVKIRILTNSLASTDVVAVHAVYARWRKELLQEGITLYEFKPMAPTPGSAAAAAGASRRYSTGSEVGIGGAGSAGLGGAAASAGSGASVTGSSGASSQGSSGSAGPLGSLSSAAAGAAASSASSLHAKSFSVDGRRVIIGSFNLDPRSVALNTELSFVIESPPLARAVDEAYSRNVPLTAWEVTLTESGALQWIGQDDGRVVRYDREPGVGLWRRVTSVLLGFLPIGWLL